MPIHVLWTKKGLTLRHMVQKRFVASKLYSYFDFFIEKTDYFYEIRIILNYRNQGNMPRMCKECIYREDRLFSCKAFKAFRAGIPNDILSGAFIHDRVHPDQLNRLIYDPETG